MSAEFHRWLFADKDGKEIKFPQRGMPYAAFKENAVWGGPCTIGDTKCRIRIRHNSEGEKGRRLEIWFPDRELGVEVPFEHSTHVGYVKISGSFQKGTGKCFFEPVEEDDLE